MGIKDIKLSLSTVIILFLFSTLILLITRKWIEIPNLVSYISFAATLISITLAILAIIYSFFSNSTFVENITILNSAASQVKKSAEELNRSMMSIESRTQALPDIIKGHFENLKIALDTKNLPDSVSKTGSGSEKEDIEWSEEGIKTFLRRCSFTGTYICYILLMAYINKKQVNLEDLLKKIDMGNIEYCHGFLVAAYCSKIVEFDLTDSVINVKELNEYLDEGKIADIIKERADYFDKKYPTMVAQQTYTSKLMIIKDYFNQK